MKNFFLLVFVIFSFMGCSSMKPNYQFCKESDWKELGMKDGLADQKMQESFHKYKKMCGSFDEKEMKPNMTMYSFGHATGVKNLCTYTKGRSFGMAQKVTSNNCSKTQHKDFYRGIADGVNEYCEYDAGYKEALKGIVTSKVCLKQTHKKFYQGIAAGVKTYCTYQYGVNIGKNDMSYTGICSGQSEQEFMKGFTIGQNQSEISKLRAQTRKLELSNVRLEEKVNGLTSDNQKLRNQIRRLESDKTELENKIERYKNSSNVLY